MTAHPHAADTSDTPPVAPHDFDAEASLLAACMAYRDARVGTIDLKLTAADFYDVAHGHTYRAIRALHDAEQPVDPTTVVGELRHAGAPAHLDRGYLFGILDNPTGHWLAYAGTVKAASRRRQLLLLNEQLRDRVVAGDPIDTIVDQIAQLQDLDVVEQSTSWAFVDLLPIVTGQTAPIVPELLTRADGQALLYPGRIHALNAEPEAGKSMLAVEACRQEIAGHHHVVYLDFEDSAESVVGRLVAMGADPDDIVEYFHYARIDDPIDHHARQLITATIERYPLTLAIIDGVAEALAMSGWQENDNHDIALFYTALPRHISKTGTTVLIIDHVVKNKDDQGRYGRGGGHKLAGIDGATYKLEAVQPFGRGLDGWSKLTIAKDRPGWLRHIGKTIAEMHIHSDENGDHITVELRASSTPPKGSDEPFRPTHLMEAVSRLVESHADQLTTNDITKSIPARRRQFVIDALQLLVDDGYIERRPGPRRSQLHTSLKPFRNDQPHPSDPPHNPDDEPPNDDQHDLWEDTGDATF